MPSSCIALDAFLAPSTRWLARARSTCSISLRNSEGGGVGLPRVELGAEARKVGKLEARAAPLRSVTRGQTSGVLANVLEFPHGPQSSVIDNIGQEACT